jgi:hypothetical protein
MSRRAIACAVLAVGCTSFGDASPTSSVAGDAGDVADALPGAGSDAGSEELVWRENHSSGGPTGYSGYAMIHDEARGQVITVGGGRFGEQPPEISERTYAWTRNGWRDVTAGLLTERAYHALAYDHARQRVVLFGGLGPEGLLDDTWEWDGDTWIEVTPATDLMPSPRMAHAMAYDPASGRVILFGGVGEHVELLGETWTWDGQAWVELAFPESPSPRMGHRMAGESASGRVILFGGAEGDEVALNDTWAWLGDTWAPLSPDRSPPPQSHVAMAYHAASGRLISFDGHATRETWAFDGTTWSNLTPPISPPSGSSMAYDASRRLLVLLGEGDVDGTWELAGPAD